MRQRTSGATLSSYRPFRERGREGGREGERETERETEREGRDIERREMDKGGREEVEDGKEVYVSKQVMQEGRESTHSSGNM